MRRSCPRCSVAAPRCGAKSWRRMKRQPKTHLSLQTKSQIRIPKTSEKAVRRRNPGMLRAVVLWLFCMVPLALPAASRLPELIEQADQVRSGNPAQFTQLLEQIKPLEGEATTQQHDKIAYLRAYAATYAGRCDEAVFKSNQIIAD